jgi:DNA invertase Pin-like site-specific DNA recombinase
MTIGYARVSTNEQNPNLQKDALKACGCEKIFTDTMSGTVAIRPNLEKARAILRRGDMFVVWRLDRLGRSLKDLIEWAAWMEKEGVAFKSLKENIDTSSPTGKLVFHLLGALSEFERNLIVERTKAGLVSARARGIKGGRPKSLSKDKRELLLRLYEEKKKPVKKICAMMGISKPTLYSYVRAKQGLAAKEKEQHK